MVAAACAVASWRRLRSLRIAPGSELDSRLGVRRVRTRVAAEALLDQLAEGSIRDALGDVLRAEGERAIVGALNELGLEMREELEVGSRIPAAAARVSLAAGTLAAVVALAGSLGGEGAVALPEALLAFLGGALGAGTSAGIGRRADARTKERRDRFNGLLRDLASILEVPEPASRR